MSLVEQEKIDQILDATDIVQLIGGYVKLKSSGKNYLGLCPFHQEKTPSFVVSPTRQNYHCYGCGAHGNAIRFLMEIERYPFLDVLKNLAGQAGIDLNIRRVHLEKSSHDINLRDCVKIAADFYSKHLAQAAQDSEIINYLKQRNLSNTQIEEFRIGFAPSGWRNLHETLLKKSISTEIQENCGLIKQGDKGNYYDRLRNRLIFPIREIRGNIIGFGGRAISNDDIPKYLNSPETELYKKSSVFYGIYEAREQIRKKNRAIIVEGYMDVIGMHSNGWKETIATCGTSLTSEHIQALKKLHISKCYLLFDGDRAGIQAAKKSARLFLESDIDSLIIRLPNGLDPDDYFKEHSSESFQELIDQAVNDYDFLINDSKQNLVGSGIEFQQQEIKELLGCAEQIKNNLKREIFINKIADAFKLSPQLLRKTNTGLKKKTAKKENIATESNGSVNINTFRFEHSQEQEREIRLIQYLVSHLCSIQFVRNYIKPEELTNSQLFDLYSRLLQLTDSEYKSLQARELPEIFPEQSRLILHLQQTENQYNQAFSEKYLERLIYRVKKREIELLLDKIKQEESKQPGSAETFRQLLNQKKQLQKEISKLNHRRDPHEEEYYHRIIKD